MKHRVTKPTHIFDETVDCQVSHNIVTGVELETNFESHTWVIRKAQLFVCICLYLDWTRTFVKDLTMFSLETRLGLAKKKQSDFVRGVSYFMNRTKISSK